jgi:hypothetical protein
LPAMAKIKWKAVGLGVRGMAVPLEVRPEMAPSAPGPKNTPEVFPDGRLPGDPWVVNPKVLSSSPIN